MKTFSRPVRRQDEMAFFLYQALAEPIGLILSCSDPFRAKNALYSAKYSSGDPALGEIQIRTSPFPEGDLIIVNQTVTVSRENQKEHTAPRSLADAVEATES